MGARRRRVRERRRHQNKLSLNGVEQTLTQVGTPVATSVAPLGKLCGYAAGYSFGGKLHEAAISACASRRRSSGNTTTPAAAPSPFTAAVVRARGKRNEG